MKKKFLVLTLCFTLVFSGFNYKKSYADGGIISLPILATVSALAVGTGIVINSNDDLYDLGNLFYNYVDKHNDLTWQTVNASFLACSSLSNGFISVDSGFLDIVKSFFDDTFVYDSDITYIGAIPLYPNTVRVPVTVGSSLNLGNGISYSINTEGKISFSVPGSKPSYYFDKSYEYLDLCFNKGTNYTLHIYRGSKFIDIGFTLTPSQLGVGLTFPYEGGYTWDNVESKKENENVSLPIPGDLGSLVGQTSDKFWDNTDNLVGNGSISIPGVDSPSIVVDDTVTFPGVDSDVPGVGSPSVPNEGIWSTIKDFVIGLFVPSDTFWTDTWGGLYNNFTNSFPMVDMDGFNDLVTGEKKFPNIDINIMGVNGRVVNGDVINSIVDWLRPIIAGFMMLCLMLFNYRKIYKLIRNSEPFGGIASGTSDFKTGISEYNKDSIKVVDMSSEYRSWKENGGR